MNKRASTYALSFAQLPIRAQRTMAEWDKLDDLVKEARISGLLHTVRTMAYLLSLSKKEDQKTTAKEIQYVYDWIRKQKHPLFLGSGTIVADPLSQFM